jgi:ribosomal protein S3
MLFYFFSPVPTKSLPFKINKIKGLRIGLFGKLFGRRRSKKYYLTYKETKGLANKISLTNLNFTFLKSWTYYGAFGIKI